MMPARRQPNLPGLQGRVFARVTLTRAVALAACLLGIASLCFYSSSVGPRRVDTIKELKAFSRLGYTKEIRLVSDVRVRGAYAASMELEQGGSRVVAFVPPSLEGKWQRERSDIDPDDFISLRGSLEKSGRFVVDEYHVHKGRRLKIWLSLGVVLLTFAFLVYQWRYGEADA